MSALPNRSRKVKSRSPKRGAKKQKASPQNDSIGAQLLKVADRSSLFNFQDEGYAQVLVDEHFETYPVNSRQFKRWVVSTFYRETGLAPSRQMLETAIETVSAKASFDGERRDVFLRVGEQGESLYLDLCDAEWRVIEISADGWQVCSESPVLFRRAAGMLSLPEPKTGGSWEDFRRFLNIEDDDFILLQGWMVAALNTRGPFPIFACEGGHGTAKTTMIKVMKSLIDPTSPSVRSAPRSERDLMIAAHNSFFLAFDNLSMIRPWFSDAMCRLATGGGLSTRTNYTDSEETRFDATRPQALTAITDVVVRPDLLDRSILISPPPISPRGRKEESVFWKEFNEARPYLFGTLLDSVVCSLRNRSSVHLQTRSRMADFEATATAAESSFGIPSGAFVKSYERNQKQAHSIALEASLVAPVLFDKTFPVKFSGNCADLLKKLSELAPLDSRRQRWWPKSPRALSAELRRIQPNLASAEIEVNFERETGTKDRRRLVHITKRVEPSGSSDGLDDSDGRVQPSRAEILRRIRDMEVDNWDDVPDISKFN